MAKFITTTTISYTIETLIKDAKNFIILVSPYLNIHVRLKKIIEQRLCEKKSPLFIIICKKNEVKNDELRWLNSQPKIEVINCPNLHAKCYLNEKIVVATSMNLYEYSAVNNVEFGFSVGIKDDFDNYQHILCETISMLPKEIFEKFNKSRPPFHSIDWDAIDMLPEPERSKAILNLVD